MRLHPRSISCQWPMLLPQAVTSETQPSMNHGQPSTRSKFGIMPELSPMSSGHEQLTNICLIRCRLSSESILSGSTDRDF